ncbi:MAG TPA: hypothetical protein VHG69_10165 [Thermoleophilaceae bacterium]|nr:hypothetical protein [Thermoleophilaceae bacterium]
MSSQPRSSGREEERRLNIRTLSIASTASAAAAVITSQFWVQGTWMAAAVTPVIVALVSEMLHRPTEKIAERVTSRGTPILPATRGPARPSRREPAGDDEPAPAEPGARGEAAAPPVRVYKSGSGKPVRPRAARRKIAIGVVAATAVLAFAITAIALTGTELLTGGSIGKGEGRTTLFSDDSSRPEESEERRDSQPEGPSPQPDQPDSRDREESPSQRQPDEPSGEPPAEEPPQGPAPEAPQLQSPQQP